MGGEKTVGRTLEFGGKGSPPHGRGKVEKPTISASWVGITPAWAGKSRKIGDEEIVA